MSQGPTRLRRERELSSSRRAGAWSRRNARELQYHFVRVHWPVFGVLALVFAATAPLYLLFPEPARYLGLGAWIASYFWGAAMLITEGSGSSSFSVGEAGERWTSDELSPLKKRGWLLVNRVVLRPWDIDHVLLGPAGVVVVETKSTATDWTDRWHRERIAAAAEQVRDNARDIRLMLRPDIKEAPVHAVVALWPSPPDDGIEAIDGVSVVPGGKLRSWIDALPQERLEDEAATRAWERLANHLEKRDAHDLQRDGPAPRSVGRFVGDMVQLPIGVLVGATVAAQLVGWPGWPLMLAPATVIAAAAYASTRLAGVRRLAAGVLVGLAAVTAIMMIAIAASALG